MKRGEGRITTGTVLGQCRTVGDGGKEEGMEISVGRKGEGKKKRKDQGSIIRDFHSTCFKRRGLGGH